MGCGGGLGGMYRRPGSQGQVGVGGWGWGWVEAGGGGIGGQARKGGSYTFRLTHAAKYAPHLIGLTEHAGCPARTEGGSYTFRLTHAAKHAINYTVSADVIGFGVFYSPSTWARVPFYGEPLQQKKGTRPKNEDEK